MALNDLRTLYVSAGVALYSFFSGLGLPLLALSLFRGFENQSFFIKNMFYYGIGGVSAVAVLAIGILSIKYKWWKLFFHAPEESLLKDTPVVKKLTIWNMIHTGVIFGLLMSLVSSITQTFFVFLPATEFQVANTGKLILGTEPPATMETLFIIVILSVIYSLVLRYINKQNLPKSTAYLALLIAFIGSTATWVGIHVFRYGAVESNLFGTLIFGAVGSFLTILTGSGIIWYLWHFSQNFFLKAREIFPDTNITTTIIIIIIIYIVMLILSRTLRKRNK